MVAAHLHLGNLPLEGSVGLKDILALPGFDRSDKDDYGIPSLMGKDEWNNDVYIMGFGMKTWLCDRMMEDLFRIMGRAEEVLLVDALASIGLSVRLGGVLSRGLGMVRIGRPLAAWGMLRSLERLRGLVRTVKEVVQTSYG